MKMLVTGGAGFIGSHLVDALLTRGETVHVLDNLATGKVENIPDGVPFHQLDLNDPTLPELLLRERFDVILHQAAQMNVRASVDDPMHDARVNILGSVALLQAAVRSGVKRVLFASSGGTVYGALQSDTPATEEHPTQPDSPYGIAKLTVEHYLHFFRTTHGLASVALRYANVYGPRQNPHGEAGVIAIFAQRLAQGQPITINGDGHQTRDYVHVSDVVAANLAVLDAPKLSGSFNVGTGAETNVNEIAQHLTAYFGGADRVSHGPAKPGELLRNVVSPAKLTASTGWQPAIALADGLPATLPWFEAAYASATGG